MAFGKGLTALILLFTSIGVSNAAAALTKRVLCSDRVHTVSNAACCALFPIVEDLKENMMDGECGDETHTALRLMFHDAIGISPTQGGGGADGSIAVFNATELLDPGNAGIDDALDVAAPFLAKYAHILTPGDFIQLAGAVSLTNCAGAPRLNFLLGRPAPKAPAPLGLVPEPFASADTLLERFAEVGFSPAELVALLASHTVAGADDVDPTIPGTPFDSTPTIFDTQFFLEVLLNGTLFPGDGPNQGEVLSPIAGELRLQSDFELARSSVTACEWQSFVNDQSKLQSAFGAAAFKLSLLGQNTERMIDCSEVIPEPPTLKVQATFPPTLTKKDIQQVCNSAFPKLSTQPGPATAVPAIPQS